MTAEFSVHQETWIPEFAQKPGASPLGISLSRTTFFLDCPWIIHCLDALAPLWVGIIKAMATKDYLIEDIQFNE